MPTYDDLALRIQSKMDLAQTNLNFWKYEYDPLNYAAGSVWRTITPEQIRAKITKYQTEYDTLASQLPTAIAEDIRTSEARATAQASNQGLLFLARHGENVTITTNPEQGVENFWNVINSGQRIIEEQQEVGQTRSLIPIVIIGAVVLWALKRI